jgi:hypothetical protein
MRTLSLPPAALAPVSSSSKRRGAVEAAKLEIFRPQASLAEGPPKAEKF